MTTTGALSELAYEASIDEHLPAAERQAAADRAAQAYALEQFDWDQAADESLTGERWGDAAAEAQYDREVAADSARDYARDHA
jgi:hypothetical protein